MFGSLRIHMGLLFKSNHLTPPSQIKQAAIELLYPHGLKHITGAFIHSNENIDSHLNTSADYPALL